MLEEALVTYCSPTLANLKTANLFCYRYHDKAEFKLLLNRLKQKLKRSGIKIEILVDDNYRALVYVYRPERLRRDFQNKATRRCLKSLGYDVDLYQALGQLAVRIRSNAEFPHEIGLFLGFPPGDVMGFIENGGRNAKCSGCWKVYDDEHTARLTFKKYKHCTDVYRRCFQNGTKFLKLCVRSRFEAEAS